MYIKITSSGHGKGTKVVLVGGIDETIETDISSIVSRAEIELEADEPNKAKLTFVAPALDLLVDIDNVTIFRGPDAPEVLDVLKDELKRQGVG